MTYDEAVNYIEDIPKFTKKTTLDHTDRLLEVLGHPERKLSIIHVAGTNGKGSVCAYLNSMLGEGGYKVGMFTSPHLIRHTERFMIDGLPVEDEIFVDAFTRVMEASKVTMAAGDQHPTYFETLFLMGILIFADAGVDYTILEVGMGGRLDATNVIKNPLACIIASISIDHTQYLGTTIPEIAFEKAGIIKPGIPVIFDGKDSQAADVIRRKAQETGSPCFELTPDMYRPIQTDKAGVSFTFDYDQDEKWKLTIPQVAEYQMMNASLAFFTMQLLARQGKVALNDRQMVRGLSMMKWPCRMETVMEDVIIDGAHNEDGIARFIQTVEHFHKDQEITILFGSVADKRYPDMIRELAEGIHPDRVVVTKVAGSREESEDTFADLFRQAGCEEVFAEPNAERAFDIARSLMGSGMLFCVGSLYLAGELKDYIRRGLNGVSPDENESDKGAEDA